MGMVIQTKRERFTFIGGNVMADGDTGYSVLH